ncbi:MAG: prepilin peptidase [Armatimonadota bacterium]|nr:prepilin peptidase [Armatimonadota bacterium]MDR7532752.1 prepilin peptidase [Armatimonadota bacterium]MDR7537100.1 prepilin peptidase [Armatimonadota bacterium]
MLTAAYVLVLTALGAVLGSFANVLIYRLPREESVVTPGSRCPECKAPIRPRDNIPVLSYALLRGRCRVCHQRISLRYPLVEMLMAVLTVAVGLRVPLPLGWRAAVEVAGALLFVFLLVVITFIDLDHQLILNWLTYPGVVAGVLLAAALGRLVPALIAGVGAGALILLIVVASRGGMGLGDVKLAVLIGVFLASPAVTGVALFLAFVIGGLFGLALLTLRVRGRKDPIPFGPFLALGALGAIFWGEAIIRWYWQ